MLRKLDQFTRRDETSAHAFRLYFSFSLLTEDVSKRFSFELVFSNFLNLFCNCCEHVDLRNAGGGGIKRGLFGKGINSAAAPTI